MLTLIKILSCLPLSVLYTMGSCILYPLIFYVTRYRRTIVRKNLKKSFPTKSSSEIRQIERAFYHHFVDIVGEIIYGYRISEKEINERVVFENIDLVEQLAADCGGVLCMLGHVGNWEWIADLGHRFKNQEIQQYNIYRKLKHASSDQAMLALRAKRGGDCMEKNTLYRQLVKMRDNPRPLCLGMLSDQKPSPKNAHIWTNFLHQDTAFLDGSEIIAKKFGYGVVYAHIECVKRGYYKVRFELLYDGKNEQMQPPEAITLAYARKLEENIKEQPEQWLWTHNRWKWSR